MRVRGDNSKDSVYNGEMNTTDESEEMDNDTVNKDPETDGDTYKISHEDEDGLSVKIEAIPDTSDPATEGVGD